MSGAAVRRLLLLVAVIPALAFGACSSDDEPTVAARTVPAKVNLPRKVLGLEVVEENVKTNITSIKASYLQSLGLFSFREGKTKGDELLRATLQVGRFNDVAEQDKERFRNAIVGNLGSTVPVELRVGNRRPCGSRRGATRISSRGSIRRASTCCRSAPTTRSPVRSSASFATPSCSSDAQSHRRDRHRVRGLARFVRLLAPR